MNFWRKSTWNPKHNKESPEADEDQNISLVKVTKIRKKSLLPPMNINVLGNIKESHKSDYENENDEEDRTNGETEIQQPVVHKKISMVRFSSIRFSKKNSKRSSKNPIEVEEIPLESKPTLVKYRTKRAFSNDAMMNSPITLRSDIDYDNHRTRAAVSVYILDHLMTAKKIEMLENMYGGKEKAQNSAKVIQKSYRAYLMRKNKFVSLSLKRRIKGLSLSSADGIGRRKSRIWIDNSANANKIDYDPNDPFDLENNCERKRLFYLGVNLFNRSCNKGIDFLLKNKILDNDPSSVMKFFETNGLSNYAKGDYLSQDSTGLALESRRFYIANMSFYNMSIEKSIRQLFSFLRIPGETQKILNMLTDFSEVYLTHNPEFEKQLNKNDSVVLLSFTILMLHTSLFNPSAKKTDRLTQDQFLAYFKHLNDEKFIDENYLRDIYESIKKKQMKPLSDHTDLVRSVYNHLTGPLVPKDLIQNHRKLVCQFNVNEIKNITKKPKDRQHQRELFLFNDIMMVTKKIQNVNYQVRVVFQLGQLNINEFQTEHYRYGLEIRRSDQPRYVLYLNCISADNRNKIVLDITSYINEVTELVALRNQLSSQPSSPVPINQTDKSS